MFEKYSKTSKTELLLVLQLARNFCSGLALILTICCYWPRRGDVLGTRKEGRERPGGGNVRGGNVGRNMSRGECPAPVQSK